MAHKTPNPAASPASSSRLGAFIRENASEIATEWTAFAKTRTPASDKMSAKSLRDHIIEILSFVADDLETSQSGSEQLTKSKGDGPKDGNLSRSAAEIHAALRLIDGFDIGQMVSEYRALRASVVKLWSAGNRTFDTKDVEDLIRFNEAIDQSMTESINHYTKTVDYSRNLFLGILSHDLRTPIGAASMSADLMMHLRPEDAKQKLLASQIVDCTGRATKIIEDLLDLTRTRFGSELPIAKLPTDIAKIGRQVVNEVLVLHPRREIALDITGTTVCEVDAARIGQIFSNLIGNAIQYGKADRPITVKIKDSTDEVTISIRNEGERIPEDKIGNLFDALVRGEDAEQPGKASVNVGLGLYIVKKIVDAHEGRINVTSSAEKGTEFTVKIPRK